MTAVPRAIVRRTLADLLPKYLHNRRADAVAARAAIERADFVTVKSIGHRMKGSGSGYGFHGITLLGAQLEQASLRSDGVEAARLVDALDDYLNRVQIEIV